MRKKARDDIYSIENVVYTSGKRSMCKVSSENDAGDKRHILVPEFRVLNEGFYKEEPSDGEIEVDTDNRYEGIHGPYELAESCNRYFNNGLELPDSFKGGLKIKLHLPQNSSELPLLIQ